MIFFSSHEHRACVSAHPSKRNYRLKRQSTQPHYSQNFINTTIKQNKQNFTESHEVYQTPQYCVDPYNQQMKFLIEQNSEYFQNKINITDKLRPNQYRFKIPTRTPATIYKKNFPLKNKNLSVDNLKLNRNILSQTIKIKPPQQNLLFNSTYKNQFTFKKQILKKHKKTQTKSKPIKDEQLKQQEDVPRFMETQNNCFYLNWGGRNSVKSLKPSFDSTAMNFPFNGKTIYKSDFQGRTVTPSGPVVPQSSISKLSNSLMISKSSYASDFGKCQKRGQVEKSYKPKHIPVKMSDSLKGASEYRSQFVSIKQVSDGFSHAISRQDLHNLILEL